MSVFSLAAVSTKGSSGPADPFMLDESNPLSSNVWKNTSGLVPVSFFPDPAKKTLCLIIAGQSNWTNVTPTLYTPNAKAFQLNICDGGLYAISAKMLGCSDDSPGGYGPGNLSAYLADKALSANGGAFDNVIIECIAIGGSTNAQWATGAFASRVTIAMKRFAARGITPATTGVTFAFVNGQGEADNTAGTSTGTYQGGLGVIFASLDAAGFSGRKFIPLETLSSGSTSSAIRTAQGNVVNGTTVFAGGDLDTLTGGTNRYGDLTHFNDVGAPAAATLVWNAMHASGSPF